MSNFFIDPEIARAKTLDTSFYTDLEIFQSAKEKLFAASWQFIGSTELVKEPGEAFPLTILEDYLDEPLVLCKDKNGTIRLLSNVCTHRGNIIVDKACKLVNLRCRYHGRLF